MLRRVLRGAGVSARSWKRPGPIGSLATSSSNLDTSIYEVVMIGAGTLSDAPVRRVLASRPARGRTPLSPKWHRPAAQAGAGRGDEEHGRDGLVRMVSMSGLSTVWTLSEDAAQDSGVCPMGA